MVHVSCCVGKLEESERRVRTRRRKGCDVVGRKKC